MKKIKFLSLLTLLSLFIILTACDKTDDLANDNAIAGEKTGLDELPAIDQLTEPLFSESLNTDDIVLLNDGMPADLETGFDNTRANIGKYRFNLNRLKDTLNLSAEQYRKLRYTYRQHFECQLAIYKQLRRVNKQIIDKADAYKKALIKKYRNGDITKAEFDKYLKELYYKTKKALKENKDRQALIAKLKICHKNFIENIRLILDKDQWELFKEFYKKFKDSKSGNK